jgi:transposase-like protein
VPAYIRVFLDEQGYVGEGRKHYVCRVCGREWEKRSPQTRSEGTRPSLIRLEDKG